jgi:hypothetical protein
MKKKRRSASIPTPLRAERTAGCTGKRRYRSQGDALDAALVVGVERSRQAYICANCGFWHLASRAPRPF